MEFLLHKDKWVKYDHLYKEPDLARAADSFGDSDDAQKPPAVMSF